MICQHPACDERADINGYCLDHADPDDVRVRVLELEEGLRRLLVVTIPPSDARSQRQARAISKAYDLLPEYMRRQLPPERGP